MSDYLIDLSPDERVVAEVRRHMFVFYSRVFWVFVAAAAPLFFAVSASELLERYTEQGGGVLFSFIYLLWFLFLWVVFFLYWTDYYLDVWVITTNRIFDVEQKGMFNRNISVFLLEQIQDVTVEVRGPLATFIKYGDVHIHTAGEMVDFVIRDAARPLEIKRIIMEEHARALRRG